MARVAQHRAVTPSASCPPGFTLIEVLMVLAIIALLLSIVSPRYFNTVGRAEEAVLKEDLVLLRDAIDKHYADTGKYPNVLEDLVSKRYLRSVPSDPITQSAETWVLVPPADSLTGAVYDIHSGAKGQGRDGRPYERW